MMTTMADESVEVVENLQIVRDAVTRAVLAREERKDSGGSTRETRLVAVSKETETPSRRWIAMHDGGT